MSLHGESSGEAEGCPLAGSLGLARVAREPVRARELAHQAGRMPRRSRRAGSAAEARVGQREARWNEMERDGTRWGLTLERRLA